MGRQVSHRANNRYGLRTVCLPLIGCFKARSEVPSSRSSMVDSASEMSESDTDAMSLSGKLSCDGHVNNVLTFKARVFGLEQTF